MVLVKYNTDESIGDTEPWLTVIDSEEQISVNHVTVKTKQNFTSSDLVTG